MKIDKAALLEQIKTQLETDRVALMAAAQSTYEAATGEESRPENEYDTRALEASYLAGAQAKRVADIDEQLAMVKTLEIQKFNDKSAISATALIELDLEGHHSFVFLLPKGGGLFLNHNGVPVQIVTPVSPLGEALIGLKQGDTALVEVGDETREYEILKVE